MQLIQTRIIQELANQAKLELARRHYMSYCELVHYGRWKAYKVHKLLCEKLEEILAGKQKKIIIEMPPRHGKSNTVSETFPSRYLMQYPDNKVIITSRDDNLAERFGLLNRRKFTEWGEKLFGLRVSKDNASKTVWSIEGHAGGLLAAPILGGITGNGANLLIVDDPVKNRQEADSETIREKIWSEWHDTLLTRLEGNASIIVIMTRWHDDDLVGRLIIEGGWDVIRLPVVCEDKNDLLGRKIGDLLCPELGFDADWAEDKKRAVGTRTWNALYQQRPAPESGGLVKREWFKRYKKVPEKFDRYTQSWDCAFKGGEDNDYVAGGVWGQVGADHYLLHIFHKQIDFVETIQAVSDVTSKYPKAIGKLIEEKANGPAVINVLSKKIGGIISINPKDSKEARVNASSPLIEAGNVYIPEGAEGDELIEEFCVFPNGKHDDLVDMTTQYLNYISNKPTAKIISRDLLGL